MQFLQLRDALLSFINQGYDSEFNEDEFNKYALSLHNFQRKHCKIIDMLTEKIVKHWKDIPLVPVSLFSIRDIAFFPVSDAVVFFESSGTTSSVKSRHFFYDLLLYQSASICGAMWSLNNKRYRVISLWDDRPHSSLSAMIDWIAKCNKINVEAIHYSQPPTSNSTGSPLIYRQTEDNTFPILLIGAAFNFVNIIDDKKHFKLPEGSVVIETGGYKGKTRDIPKQELYLMISESFDIPEKSIISEYGMCEISTPLWERVNDSRGFYIPPWVRIRIINPDSFEETDRGVIAIYDLANINSSIGILTADTGYIENDKLFLTGRLNSSPIKGCSTTVG